MDFTIKNDRPIDYVKECNLWVIGTEKVKARSMTIPPLKQEFMITCDTPLAKTIKIITNESVDIVPNDDLELRVAITHYSDDDTILKSIVIRGCKRVGVCREFIEYGTTKYEHNFKFRDWINYGFSAKI